MEIILTNQQFNVLKNKIKIYSYLGGLLSKTTFKVANNIFSFLIKDQRGIFQTNISIDYVGPSYYFSVDLNKWQTALLKYETAEKIKISLGNNSLKIYSDSTDVINLGVTYFDESSSEATIINDFINKKRDEFKQNSPLSLSDDIVDSLILADNFFNYQTTSNVNSVGLGRDAVIYSDKSLVLKARLTESLPKELFDNLPGGENYIYIPTFIIKLFSLLYKTNTNIYFTKEYNIIFWEDNDSALVLVLDLKKIALPTDEQFNMIKPQDLSLGFDVSPVDLKEGLNFFAGFYEGSVWKPIEIDMIANKEVSLHYKHPSTEINKLLNNTVSNIDGSYLVDSEALKKYTLKVCDKLPSEKIHVNCDDDAMGIYFNTANKYELVLLKLEDD